MNCTRQLLHVIKKGDNLYQLSKYYKTTVISILNKNPDLDPYNLQIGTEIVICPGEKYDMQSGSLSASFCPNPTKMISLRNNMRLAWSQHVYWTRMLIISMAERLKDQEAVTNRLLRNPKDLAMLFANYYSKDVQRTIERLVTDHLNIGAAFITALRDGNVQEADRLEEQWYQNADQMAMAFAEMNPFYNEQDIQHMFYDHLMITKKVAQMRLEGNYSADIEAFDRAERQMMDMADHFANGIISQFPQEFS